MNNVALRSDCNSARPMLVFVVTKNVRAELRTPSGFGVATWSSHKQGLKPNSSPRLFGTAEAVP